jgi:hypothetical protein
MLQCPLCRALLNGADTCRRCRAQLKQALELERQAGQIAGEAMHALALGKTAVALRLLGRDTAVGAHSSEADRVGQRGSARRS